MTRDGEAAPTRRTVTTGRRTTLRPGAEADYARVHSRIPHAVELALRASGVVRWNIWRDGTYLFHTIETIHGYDEMVAAIEKAGPIDAAWDALIASLLESEPSSDVLLDPVWAMDPDGQHT